MTRKILGRKLAPLRRGFFFAPRSLILPPMCGRHSIATAPEALRCLFRLPGPLVNLPPCHNRAPTQEAPVVRQREDGGEREPVMLRW